MNILEIERMNVWFGGLHAVSDLNMRVAKGEIHSLIGPNGAGKTTVFNAIMNIVKKSGRVVFSDIDITNKRTHEIAALGIRRSFQNVHLFKYMTVLENLLVGYHTSYEIALNVKKLLYEERRAYRKAFDVADLLEIKNRLGVPALLLPYGVQKVVEIGRALMSDPRLLMMDEPAAGLTESETEWLHSIIKRINSELGITLLLIEHDMKLVMGISDTITVMDFGKKIAEGTPQQIKEDERVIKAYLGEVIL